MTTFYKAVRSNRNIKKDAFTIAYSCYLREWSTPRQVLTRGDNNGRLRALVDEFRDGRKQFFHIGNRQIAHVRDTEGVILQLAVTIG